MSKILLGDGVSLVISYLVSPPGGTFPPRLTIIHGPPRADLPRVLILVVPNTMQHYDILHYVKWSGKAKASPTSRLALYP
jgi:hypothetical protein